MGILGTAMVSLLLRAFLISALVAVADGSCIAKLQSYMNAAGGLNPTGMVMVSGAKVSYDQQGQRSGEYDLEVSYDLQGLEANYAAGIHIHTGTSCHESYVSGHFFATPVDPWTTTTVTSDGNGDTTGKFNVNAGLSMCDVTGHVVVVHSSTERIACGVCYESCTANIQAYPGTTGGKYSSVAGSVSVSGAPAGVPWARSPWLTLSYSLTGVEPGVAAGLHIHTGTTCADADYVAGHFFATDLAYQQTVSNTATSADPWFQPTSTADQCGATSGKIDTVLTGLQTSEHFGHAVVVHDGSGARIGCGICKKATECGHRYDTCTAKMGLYPGYTGSLQPSGKVQVSGSPGSGYGYKSNINLAYVLAGILPAYGAPMHIHTGTTCVDHGLVAGHYFASLVDPWGTRTLVTDGAGAVTGTIADVHSGLSSAQSVGHAVVVHDGPNRIACGVCVPTCTATIAGYPGYTGSYPGWEFLTGTVKATATDMFEYVSTIDLEYTLTGAEPNAAAGIHIHVGTNCADANLVSGHYFATASDPWSTTTTSVADTYGDVAGAFTVAAGLGFEAIVDHTIVVHDSAGARIGCGVCVPDSVTPPIATASLDTCSDVKSVFKTNACCGDGSKPLNEQIISS